MAHCRNMAKIKSPATAAYKTFFVIFPYEMVIAGQCETAKHKTRHKTLLMQPLCMHAVLYSPI